MGCSLESIGGRTVVILRFIAMVRPGEKGWTQKGRWATDRENGERKFAIGVCEMREFWNGNWEGH